MALAMKGSSDRSCIARLFLPGLPFDCALTRPADHRLPLPLLFANAFPEIFARLRVKRDDSRIRLAADHDQQPVAFQNGRTAHTEKRGRHVPIRARLALP